jgi:hypothetical protein
MGLTRNGLIVLFVCEAAATQMILQSEILFGDVVRTLSTWLFVVERTAARVVEQTFQIIALREIRFHDANRL